MSGLLLDSSGYFHLQKGHPEAAAAVRRAGRVVLSPVVLGELRDAFRQSRDRRSNERYLAGFLSLPWVEVVDVDAETSECYAGIKESLRAAGTPVPVADVWIAASAMQHGLKVLTADADFLRIPQILVEPLSAPLLRPRRRRDTFQRV
jgi:tRNA(fMet)-specific endonuclease VapC